LCLHKFYTTEEFTICPRQIWGQKGDFSHLYYFFFLRECASVYVSWTVSYSKSSLSLNQ
jgi:hypothetical protein